MPRGRSNDWCVRLISLQFVLATYYYFMDVIKSSSKKKADYTCMEIIGWKRLKIGSHLEKCHVKLKFKRQVRNMNLWVNALIFMPASVPERFFFPGAVNAVGTMDL